MPDKDRDPVDTSVGFWVGEEDRELIERVDDRVDWRNSSRSEWIRDAVKLRLAVEDAGFEK